MFSKKLCLSMLFVASLGCDRGQTTEEPTSPPTETSTQEPKTCDPACEDGETCKGGKCLDACGGTCTEGQRCEGGKCVADITDEDRAESLEHASAATRKGVEAGEEQERAKNRLMLATIKKVRASLFEDIKAIEAKGGDYVSKETHEEEMFDDFLLCVEQHLDENLGNDVERRASVKRCEQNEDFASSRKTRFGKMLDRKLPDEKERAAAKEAIEMWRQHHLSEKK